ncbi:unnamed protein product [Mytilus coruscus]|uniref:MULE transposase domain-containing protein n=1 Tax=Mytilus coruscus TaxID=42192 RepID=A0A6J8DFY1_MYTCO|nr:unnamed protein product [Mytilus coruscus]
MQPSYVFKASKAMANLCIEMDCNKDGILNEEFAFIDAKHNRCKNFRTVTLWTYHPVLRKTICVAKMEAEAESSENLEIFWKLLNEMLEEVNNQTGYKFNPYGFIMDENSANWISVRKVFGEHILQKCASCEFHYKQSVHRHAKKVSERSADFINLAEGLLDALSISDFNVASSEIKDFIDYYAYHQQLNGWYKWWLQRKLNIFRAFKAENTPASNLAEIGHAKIASVGREFMSLLEAAREDTALSILQDAEIRLFDSGLSKGGKGPTSNQRKAKEYNAGIKRAKSYAAELDREEEPPCKSTPCFVPSKGNHRPPEGPPSKKMKPNEKPGPSQPERPLPFHVSFFGTIFYLKKCIDARRSLKTNTLSRLNPMI